MGTLKERLQHAFAVDPPGPMEPTAEQQGPVDWVCRNIAKRRMTTPGLIALEMSRPLNYLASQVMHFASPAVWAIAREQTHEQYKHFAAFLEQRGAVEYLCLRIEEFEEEYDKADRERKQDRRERKLKGRGGT